MTDQDHRILCMNACMAVGIEFDRLWLVTKDGGESSAYSGTQAECEHLIAVEFPWMRGQGYVAKEMAVYPCVSEDIREAWKIVERLKARGWIMRVQEMPPGVMIEEGSRWDDPDLPEDGSACCFLHPTPKTEAERGIGLREIGIGATPAEAICRAAVAEDAAYRRWRATGESTAG